MPMAAQIRDPFMFAMAGFLQGTPSGPEVKVGEKRNMEPSGSQARLERVHHRQARGRGCSGMSVQPSEVTYSPRLSQRQRYAHVEGLNVSLCISSLQILV